MDIYKIRNQVQVTVYYINANGATILYQRKQKSNIINLTYTELTAELIALGSLDEGQNVLDGYVLSQWDALNIAIRFEAARDMAKEIDKADIGKAIKNINNDQK